MMQRSCAAEQAMLGRERELMAQLHDLLLPPSPSPPASRFSGRAAELLDVNIGHEYSVNEAALPAGGRRRRRGSKRAPRHHDQLLPGGTDANPTCRSSKRRRSKEGVIRLETLTVPDFDGYQWRKYGQKQIEGAKYSRSYYRCTNSTDQGCPAKRTVQRNDGGDGDGDGGPPKYTVEYIAEHTCKTVESVAPVILETTVRTSNAAAAHVDVAPAHDTATTGSSGSSSSTGTRSPAISSDANSSDRYYCPYADDGVFAVDDWYPTTPPAAASLLQEMDFPIRSPVHVAAEGWSINELPVDESTINIPSNWRYLFGF